MKNENLILLILKTLRKINKHFYYQSTENVGITTFTL